MLSVLLRYTDSSTNKTDRHYRTEIVFKVALNTITPILRKLFFSYSIKDPFQRFRLTGAMKERLTRTLFVVIDVD